MVADISKRMGLGTSMVVMAAADVQDQKQGRVRPLDPARDLGQIAGLIGEAFADDMDERGRAALREMRWMARLSPLVWWLSQVDPGFRAAFHGFVWEVPQAGGRRGQIIGNVNLNRAPGSRQRYIICNVVVEKGHRGRGIGRTLTERAVEEAVALGASGAVLQVRRDNGPAFHLYTDLGFHEVSGEVDLWLDSVPSVALLNTPEYQVRAWRPGDGQALYQLAHRAIPEVQQWLKPVRREEYWPGWVTRLANRLVGLFSGRRTYRLVASRGGRLVALAQITATFRPGEHRLLLLVDPADAGQVEAALVSRALYMLAALPPAPVRAITYKDYTSTIDLLRDYGFREHRTLLTLKIDFRGRSWKKEQPPTGGSFEIEPS
jgi:ribosomal protein S18 acetylase RimI-like enzyme